MLLRSSRVILKAENLFRKGLVAMNVIKYCVVLFVIIVPLISTTQSIEADDDSQTSSEILGDNLNKLAMKIGVEVAYLQQQCPGKLALGSLGLMSMLFNKVCFKIGLLSLVPVAIEQYHWPLSFSQALQKFFGMRSFVQNHVGDNLHAQAERIVVVAKNASNSGTVDMNIDRRVRAALTTWGKTGFALMCCYAFVSIMRA